MKLTGIIINITSTNACFACQSLMTGTMLSSLEDGFSPLDFILSAPLALA